MHERSHLFNHSTIMMIQAAALSLDTSILTLRNAFSLVVVWLAYQILKALYNVSPLHPLSGIPGPKLAAATYIPEFYHDVVKFGCFTKEIKRMHEKYGALMGLRMHIRG